MSKVSECECECGAVEHSSIAAAGGVETHNHIGILMVDCPPLSCDCLGVVKDFMCTDDGFVHPDLAPSPGFAARHLFRVLAPPEHCFDLTYITT